MKLNTPPSPVSSPKMNTPPSPVQRPNEHSSVPRSTLVPRYRNSPLPLESQGIWVEPFEQLFERLWRARGRYPGYACYVPENALWSLESFYQGVYTCIVVALGKTTSIRRNKQGDVGIAGVRKSEEALEVALPRHGVEKVDAARDDGDPLVGIIEDDGKLVGKRKVRASNYEVSRIRSKGKRAISLEDVEKVLLVEFAIGVRNSNTI